MHEAISVNGTLLSPAPDCVVGSLSRGVNKLHWVQNCIWEKPCLFIVTLCDNNFMRLSPLDSHWLERHAGWTKQAPCSRKNPTELTFFSRGNVNSNYTTSTPQANMPEPL